MRALFAKSKESKTPSSPSSPMTPPSLHHSNSNTPEKSTLSPLGRKISLTVLNTTPKKKDSNPTLHMSPSAISTKDSYHMAHCEIAQDTPIRHINMDPSTTTEKDSIFNKYDYDENDCIIDPLLLLLDKGDEFISTSTFGRK